MSLSAARNSVFFIAGQQYLIYVVNIRNFTQRKKYKLHGFEVKVSKKVFRRNTVGKFGDLE